MPRLVLVADGSPSHQRRAQGILTGEGLEVLTVSNGVAAIKKLPTIRAALILADVSMPGRDGYEVCDFVKNSPELSKIPVLLSYSDQTPFDEGRAQRARADGRIKKPFGQDELLNVVNRFLPPEAAAPPPPPPPPPVQEAAEEATAYLGAPEVSLEPAPPTELPDMGALSDVSAFADQSAAEESPELNPPPVSFGEALSRASDEAAATETPSMSFGGFPASESPVTEEAATHPEPMLVEEPSEAPPENEEEPVARTMMFRMPVQLAEPVLADDSVATPPQPEEPPPPEAPPAEAAFSEAYPQAGAEPEEALPPPPPPEPSAPMSMEEQTPESAGPAPEISPAAAEEAAQASAGVVDTELVHWIVHNVVVRMAPPALSTAQVEELIRQITDEMINDLTQPPPET